MSVIKCPRCDLNFIQEEDGFCAICKKEMKGEMPKEDPIYYCIECGENLAVPGDDLCEQCLEHVQKLLEKDKIKKPKVDEISENPDEDEISDEDLVIDEPEQSLDVKIDFDFDDEPEDDAENDDLYGFYEEDVYDKVEEKEKV